MSGYSVDLRRRIVSSVEGGMPKAQASRTFSLSSMTVGGMGPSLAVDGATTARVFETYVKKVLAPKLKEGQIVIMDNLGAHRPKRIRELIEERGCELLYLPSYSPDLNPIEICQPQCAFKHKPSYHWPPRAARAPGVGREARSCPHIRSRGGSAMLSRGAVPPPSIAASQPPPPWRELPPANRRRLLLSLSHLLEHRLQEPATTPRREVNDHDRG
jgi:DDE superfamily endonuclease